uniref:Uncharacterized protein n=1 Tax=Knipowitschia caucasica TaxID=637954 RepID=A0AAV2KHS9_KNICA
MSEGSGGHWACWAWQGGGLRESLCLAGGRAPGVTGPAGPGRGEGSGSHWACWAWQGGGLRESLGLLGLAGGRAPGVTWPPAGPGRAPGVTWPAGPGRGEGSGGHLAACWAWQGGGLWGSSGRLLGLAGGRAPGVIWPPAGPGRAPGVTWPAGPGRGEGSGSHWAWQGGGLRESLGLLGLAGGRAPGVIWPPAGPGRAPGVTRPAGPGRGEGSGGHLAACWAWQG